MKKSLMVTISVLRLFCFFSILDISSRTFMAPIAQLFIDFLFNFLTGGEGATGGIIVTRLVIVYLVIILPLVFMYKCRKLLNDNYSKWIVILDAILSIIVMIALFLVYIIDHVFDRGINFG